MSLGIALMNGKHGNGFFSGFLNGNIRVADLIVRFTLEPYSCMWNVKKSLKVIATVVLILWGLFLKYPMKAAAEPIENSNQKTIVFNLSKPQKNFYTNNQLTLKQNEFSLMQRKTLQPNLVNEVKTHSMYDLTKFNYQTENLNLNFKHTDDHPEHKSGGATLFGKLFLGGLVGSGIGLLLGMMATADGEGEIMPWIIGGGIAGAIGFALSFD